MPVNPSILCLLGRIRCNQRFPIYDQHVHRAMVFVEEGRFEELDTFSEEEVVEFYLTRYLRFNS